LPEVMGEAPQAARRQMRLTGGQCAEHARRPGSRGVDTRRSRRFPTGRCDGLARARHGGMNRTSRHCRRLARIGQMEDEPRDPEAHRERPREGHPAVATAAQGDSRGCRAAS
jgi:hypothetical protein